MYNEYRTQKLTRETKEMRRQGLGVGAKHPAN